MLFVQGFKSLGLNVLESGKNRIGFCKLLLLESDIDHSPWRMFEHGQNLSPEGWQYETTLTTSFVWCQIRTYYSGEESKAMSLKKEIIASFWTS